MEVSQYLEIFIEETREHIQSLNEHILVLEKEPENEDTINEIFRAAHSLKGMAGTMGFKRMQRLTHEMESVFSEIRNGKMKATSELVDILFKGIDALESYLSHIQESADEGTEEYEDILASLKNIQDKGLQTEKPSQEVIPAATAVEPSEYGKMLFKGVKLEEHEKKAVAKADMIDLNVVGLTVYIQEYCVLKGARAFMINRTIEEHGEIIKLYPSAQDLEDEKYDLHYSAFVITKDAPDKLTDAVMNVSEVKEVYADYIRLSDEEYEYYRNAIKEDEAAQHKPKTVNDADSLKAGSAPAPKQSIKPISNRSVRVDIDKLDVLMNLVSELIIAKNSLVSISSSSEIQLDNIFTEQMEYLERVTTNLHESVMKVRMVPIESVLNRFPRMIRDLSKELNKEMELYITGEDTELDRTVIDEIGEPLMHLLRNAADHGLESRDERVRAGKDVKGSIFLDAYQDGNNVVIEVRDDGAGINPDKIRKKAVEKGFLTEEQIKRMPDKDILDILFQPGFSTSEKVSDVSGRGVGLDVVKTKIEALGGELEAKTILGQGSNFIIRLPLTLAIIQTLMIGLGGEKYALPLGNIQTIESLKKKEIKNVQDREVINLRGTVIPIIRLGNLLDCPRGDNSSEMITAVIVKKGEKLAGLIIDELFGQQEIVIKSIGKYIKYHKIVSGATILGNGEVALILDVNSLV